MESSGSSTHDHGLAARCSTSAPPDVLRPFDARIRRHDSMPQRRVSDKTSGLAARRIARWFGVGRAVRLSVYIVCLLYGARTTTSSSVVGVVIERWGTGERRRGGPRVDSLTLLVPIVILLVSVTVLVCGAASGCVHYIKQQDRDLNDLPQRALHHHCS